MVCSGFEGFEGVVGIVSDWLEDDEEVGGLDGIRGGGGVIGGKREGGVLERFEIE